MVGEVKDGKLHLSWDEFYQQTLIVGDKVMKSGFTPDVILGIIRGGLVPARIISEMLDNPRLYCMKIEFYDEDNKPTKKPNITQEIDVHLEGQKVLVVDETCETGETLKLTMDYLKKFKPKDVKVAVISVKPQRKFEPDFHAFETDKWIIHPWEGDIKNR